MNSSTSKIFSFCTLMLLVVNCGYGLDGINYEKKYRSSRDKVKQLEQQISDDRQNNINNEFTRNRTQSGNTYWSWSDSLFFQLHHEAVAFCKSKSYELPDQAQIDELLATVPTPDFLDNFTSKSGKLFDLCMKENKSTEACAALCVQPISLQ